MVAVLEERLNMNPGIPQSLIQTNLAIQPLQFLNVTFDKGYIYALNIIKANIFDVFAFSFAFIFFGYFYIKLAEKDPDLLRMDHPIIRPLKFFDTATPRLFEWLKWILILSVLLAAAQETKSLVITLVYMISFSFLIFYIMDHSILILRYLIYRIHGSHARTLSNRVVFLVSTPLFIFINIIISWSIQIITDILIRLR
jgi:hypothetical protein